MRLFEVTPQGWSIVVRTRDRPEAAAPFLRQALQRLDPALALCEITSLEELLADSVAPRRFTTLLLGLFATIALLLAVIGICGVVSYSVSQRTHEIGVRIALGAEPVGVVRQVVRQGMLPALAGLVLGTGLALACSRLLHSQLFGISANDPHTFLGVLVLVAAVSLAACYLPARRAAKVDPAVVLRYE